MKFFKKKDKDKRHGHSASEGGNGGSHLRFRGFGAPSRDRARSRDDRYPDEYYSDQRWHLPPPTRDSAILLARRVSTRSASAGMGDAGRFALGIEWKRDLRSGSGMEKEGVGDAGVERSESEAHVLAGESEGVTSSVAWTDAFSPLFSGVAWAASSAAGAASMAEADSSAMAEPSTQVASDASGVIARAWGMAMARGLGVLKYGTA